jgi:hypothetical protein
MWLDIGIVALFIVGAYAFLQLVGWRTRGLSRRSKRTAESMYGNYADSPRQQRRYARDRGASWTEGGPDAQPGQPPPVRRDS